MLSALNLNPREVIDAGVMHGTPWLYEAFPDARIYLVEPQRSMRGRLKHTPKNPVFVPRAIGAKPGRLTLSVDGSKSSVLDRTELTKGDIRETYDVEVITLDMLIGARDMQGPVGIKLDIEGFELEALRGLKRHVDKVGFLIAELSLLDRFEDSYRFEEFVSLAARKGLRMLCILNSPWPAAPMPFYDCLFLPEDHPAFRGER